jgi:non-specific serine/threonine protein kinase
MVASQPTLQARLLGQCSLSYNGHAALPTAFKRGSLTLLLWLLISPGHHLAHTKVLDTLWSEGGNPEESYRKARTAVRHGLGAGPQDPPCIVSDGQEIRLNPAIALDLDVDAFTTLARVAIKDADPTSLERAAALYAGPLLPDHLDDTLTMEPRAGLARLYNQVLRAQADVYLKASDPQAEKPLRALLKLDHAAEEPALALLRLLMTQGRWDDALRLGEQISAAIRAHGRVPSEHFTTQYTRLMQRQPATNLPRPVGGFVGRDWDVAWLTSLLERPDIEGGQRLITLTGSGGCGKTQLALKIANGVRDAYKGGVWWADLSGVSQAENVTRHVAALWMVREELGRALPDTLADYLEKKQLLLVLDNCEHLQPACAALCASFLTRCPHVRVLATSRRSLGVDGEVVHRVPSLTLPPAGPLPPPDDLATFEAVRLFLQRANARLNSANADAITAICRLLDGMPLALVLAAARLRSMSAQDLLAGLRHSLSLLAGPQMAQERQRTMQATLDWSYNLLDEREQQMLRRLSVFRGGWTLNAARAVWSLDAAEPADAGATLDLLDALVDKSLVLFGPAMDGMGVEASRYRLLEVVRQDAQHRLTTTGARVVIPKTAMDDTEQAAVEAAHAAYCLKLAQAAEPHLRGPEQVAWLARLELEHDNLRTALAWASQEDQTSRSRHAVGLRLAGALEQFWYIRGHLQEGRRWLDVFLTEAARGGTSAGMAALRARALQGAGVLAWGQADHARARALLEESLDLYRGIGDTGGVAWVLNYLGNVANTHADYIRAVALYEESLALFRGLGDKVGITQGISNLAGVASMRAEYTRANALLEEGLALSRELQDRRGMAIFLSNQGYVARSLEDLARARVLYEESLALFRELADRWQIALMLYNLGDLAVLQHDLAGATALFEESLTLSRELGQKRGIAYALLNLGDVARTQGGHHRALALSTESLGVFRELGDSNGIAYALGEVALAVQALAGTPQACQKAAQILGAAMKLRDTIHAPLPPSERAHYDEGVAGMRAALGAAAFDHAWSAGQALSLDEVITLALTPDGRHGTAGAGLDQ